MIKPGLLITLLVLCALMVAGVFLLREDRPQVKAPVNVGEKLVTDLNTDSVKSIEIKKGDVALKLEKKDKNWVMPTHKDRAAKSDRVDTLLRDVKDASKQGTRSGADATFDLDEKNRIELTLVSEAKTTTLYIGKSPDYTKSFVRTVLGGPIIEVDKGLDNDAGARTEKDQRILDPSYFFDLKIFGFSQDDVIDLSIKKGHAVTRAQKVIPGKGPVQPKQEIGKDEKPVWWLTEPEGAPADESSVNSICSNLASLNAESFADTVPEAERGLDKPSAKVKVVLKDGAEHNLTFGKLDGDKAILAVAGKPDPYRVYKYVYETVTKDLKKKEEEKKEESAAPPFSLPTAPVPVAPPVAPAVKTTVVPPPPPPPPPTKIEPDTKPKLPPAVLKPDAEKPKVEEKK